MLMSRSYYVYYGLSFAAFCFRMISAQSNFTMNGSSFKCSDGDVGNLICLGDAHKSLGPSNYGSLSLVKEEEDVPAVGIAYYYEPVRMRDPATRRTASFNTSFTLLEDNKLPNGTLVQQDGITFVISADNTSLGWSGAYLGVFNNDPSFQSVVVEFDSFSNPEPLFFDISGNHVSLDFTNITYVAAANASDVNVFLDNSTTYAWIDYSAETRLFEVRISSNPSRPTYSLLNYTVDLFNKVEEYMWVGFSGSTGGLRGFYYILDWTFQSYGIPPAPVPGSRSKAGTIVALSVGISAAVLLAGVGVFLVFWGRRRRSGMWLRSRWPFWGPSHKDNHSTVQLSGICEGYRFRYKQLSMATEGFSEASTLGQGGFRSVYRGVLPSSGQAVAVKRINPESGQGEREFIAEVSIISQLRHRNLIELLGFCDDKGKFLIVYELMPNGSLDKVLFDTGGNKTPLSWAQRFNIVRGTAAAVDYLHQGWRRQVIHRDIKASNIMLDDEWSAKLGGFGLARLVDHESTAATTLVAGTYGYIAPEAAASGRFTDKTDVFAFGAVALEIACGRRCVSWHLKTDEIVLVDWVWEHLSKGELLNVVDTRLGDEYDTYWMEVVLMMGLLCSHPNPKARPTMRQVVEVLAGDIHVPPVPASKPLAMFGVDSLQITINDLHPWVTSPNTSESKFSSKSRSSTTRLSLSTSPMRQVVEVLAGDIHVPPVPASKPLAVSGADSTDYGQ